MDPFGATSIEDWWDRFSRGFSPTLTSPVVLAGREDKAAALTRRLADEVGRTFVPRSEHRRRTRLRGVLDDDDGAGQL